MKNISKCLLAMFLLSRIADASDLVFAPEPGARVDVGAIPEAGIDSAGSTWLYYTVPVPMGGERVSVSPDGVAFPAGSMFTTFANDPRNTRLPNGTYRRFGQKNLPSNYDVSSQSSSDGINFTPDAGIRYSPAAADNGSIGIVEVFSQKNGDVVMLYLGDLKGKNNTRRARSLDGGTTFSFESGNILADDSAGGGANSYVDITTIVLPDGRRRLFAMKGGKGIYSFVSADDGQTFTQEPGARLSSTDFSEFNVIGLFDPSIVRLADGRYRMYVAADIDQGGGTIAHKILSAVTGGSGATAGEPQITSAPSATPNPAQAGALIQFSVAASGNGTLTYEWDFGDGTRGSGSSVSHSYVTAGTFNAAVTVSNDSASTNASVSVVVQAALPLTIGSLKLSSVFSQHGRDGFRLSASLKLPEGLVLNGADVVLNIAGVTTSFRLDAGKRGRVAGGSISVHTGSVAKISAGVKGGDFNSAWLDDGLVNANTQAAAVSLPVTVSIAGNNYAGKRALTYTARAGRTGSAK